jgi:hypothetical protein
MVAFRNLSLLSNMAQYRENIQVVCRVRPLSDSESRYGGTCISRMTGKEIIIRDRKFVFDGVIGPESSQETCFQLCAEQKVDVVRAVLDGFNSTIFAYGQTGSGKVSILPYYIYLNFTESTDRHTP